MANNNQSSYIQDAGEREVPIEEREQTLGQLLALMVIRAGGKTSFTNEELNTGTMITLTVHQTPDGSLQLEARHLALDKDDDERLM